MYQLVAIAILLFASGVQSLQFSYQNMINNHQPTEVSQGKSPFNEDFKDYVSKLMNHFHLPGVSVAVVDGDDIFTDVYGYSILPDVKNTPDTLFYVGSTTKSFTATSLLSLLEKSAGSANPITLQTKISSIIPADFVLPDYYATTHATLEDALTHVLGFPSHHLSYGGINYTVQDAVRSLRHLPMNAEFREKHQYLNQGYMVIQHVIETLTGKWIGDTHREVIWDPLSMNSTFIRLEDAQEAENTLAYGYSWDEIRHEVNHQPWSNSRLVGGGGIITSITDFAKYLQAVINHKLPLSEEMQAELIRPRVVSSEPRYPKFMSTSLYALGWGVTSYHGHRLINHSGQINGFVSRLAFFPEQRWGIALLANGDNPGDHVTEALFYRLMEDYFNVPSDQRLDLIHSMDEKDDARMSFYKNARTILYPDIPNPALPHSLSLSSYAGTYFNPGYQNITLTVAKPRPGIPVANTTNSVLHISLFNRLLDFALDVEHISGDNFITWTDSEVTTLIALGAYKSQFLIGQNGKVSRFGVEIEDQMIWFDKLE